MIKILFITLLISGSLFAQERSLSPGGPGVPVVPAEEKKANDIKLETPTENIPVVEEENIKTESRDFARWRFGLGLGYSMPSKQNFDKVKVSDNTGFDTGTYTYEWDSAPQLSLGFVRSSRNNWGQSINLTYVTQHKIKGASYTIDGGTGGTLVITDPAKSESYILDGNLFYRWNSFYLPFGLNYSMHKYTMPASAVGYSVDVKGGLGAQLGIGFFLSNKFSIEVNSRALNYSLSFAKPTANNYKGDFGSSFMNSLNINLKLLLD